MDETRLFDIRTSHDSLIATLPRTAPVMSWAPLHGSLHALATSVFVGTHHPRFTPAKLVAFNNGDGHAGGRNPRRQGQTCLGPMAIAS